jgi:chromosome segregation ATPase
VDLKKRYEQLQHEIKQWNRGRRDTEEQLTRARTVLASAIAARAERCVELADVEAGGDTAAIKRIEGEVDSFDRIIKSHERTIQGCETRIAKVDVELQSFANELADVGRAIAAQEHQAAFAAWQASLRSKIQETDQAINAARQSSGELSALLVEGIERFAGQAQAVAAPLIERIVHLQANADTLGGWRPAPNSGLIPTFHIGPMIRKEAAAAGR